MVLFISENNSIYFITNTMLLISQITISPINNNHFLVFNESNCCMIFKFRNVSLEFQFSEFKIIRIKYIYPVFTFHFIWVFLSLVNPFFSFKKIKNRWIIHLLRYITRYFSFQPTKRIQIQQIYVFEIIRFIE